MDSADHASVDTGDDPPTCAASAGLSRLLRWTLEAWVIRFCVASATFMFNEPLSGRMCSSILCTSCQSPKRTMARMRIFGVDRVAAEDKADDEVDHRQREAVGRLRGEGGDLVDYTAVRQVCFPM
ncbi:hypothetical protein ACFO5K_19770 [Nocardia halotolerans]|uniref:Uncharacterized protein n=1 Tax=Nocardia halotolerans TaxID=1755878 RepID=A0ABV8VLB4_9NOCA